MQSYCEQNFWTYTNLTEYTLSTNRFIHFWYVYHIQSISRWIRNLYNSFSLSLSGPVCFIFKYFRQLDGVFCFLLASLSSFIIILPKSFFWNFPTYSANMQHFLLPSFLSFAKSSILFQSHFFVSITFPLFSSMFSKSLTLLRRSSSLYRSTIMENWRSNAASKTLMLWFFSSSTSMTLR